MTEGVPPAGWLADPSGEPAGASGEPEAGFAAALALTCGRVQRLAKRRAGIPAASTTWRALHIIEAYGPLTTGEFTDLEGHAASSSTRQITRLEQEGLITRTPAPWDRRVSQLAITARGVRLCRDYERDVGRELAPVIARLTDDQRAVLRAAAPVLEALLDQMRSDEGLAPVRSTSQGPSKTPGK